MTPEDHLEKLFCLVADSPEQKIYITSETLESWPKSLVKHLKLQNLIRKASPATTAVCPGCEEDCVLEVQRVNYPRGWTMFVVCDLRDDTNRVEIPKKRLERWKTNLEDIAHFVAEALSIRITEKVGKDKNRIEVGLMAGKEQSQMLCLVNEQDLNLIIGHNRIALVELVFFDEQKGLSIDQEVLGSLADSSTTVDERYTPNTAKKEARKLETQAMYEEWRKEYRKLKRQHPNQSDKWIAMQIVKMDIAKGRNIDTIRKKMKSPK